MSTDSKESSKAVQPESDADREQSFAETALRMGGKSDDEARRTGAIDKADDEVDELYNQVYRELLLFMVQDPDTIQRATYLLWVAHDLERIADRATNIAERVIFLVSGKLVEINVSRY